MFLNSASLELGIVIETKIPVHRGKATESRNTFHSSADFTETMLRVWKWEITFGVQVLL